MKTMKIAIAIVALLCAEAAMAALTSRSYVQDGLIVQYDGINNVGHGIAHSVSTTTWVDLTGNGNDGTVNAAVGWGENGWTNSTGSIQPVTVGSGLAAAIASAGKFSAQMSITFSDSGSIRCLLGQNPSNLNSYEFNIERNSSGHMCFYAGAPLWARTSITMPIASGTWVPLTLTVLPNQQNYSFRFYNASNPNAITDNGTTISKSLQFNSTCSTVIGGTTKSDSDWAFRGTYNAFRLYNRELTEDEIKLNAAIDAVRFNGGDPSDYAILANYTFDDMGYRYYDFTATAEVGGKIHVAGTADATNATLPASAGTAATFTAVPDAGYVFQEWTGDISAITSGSLITPTISVKSASDGAVRAVFRKRGTALDGMVFDLDMQDVNGNGEIEASDKIGNAMKVSASDAANAYAKAWSTTDNETFSAYSPKFSTLDVAGPMTPFTTNSQACLVFPQHVSGGDIFNSRVDLTKGAITGEVATFFVRFKWDGAVVDAQCNPVLLMNGCNSTWYQAGGKGFAVRIRTYAGNQGKGYLTFYVQGKQSSMANDVVVHAGSWIDCFVSLYPSPTDATKSNGDIYFCTNAFNQAIGKFGEPKLNRYHVGDAGNILRMSCASANSVLQIGNERNAVSPTSTHGKEAFRGAIAAVKGWRRLLTEDEMWCVMAGVHGGVFHVGSPNGSADEFGASGTEATFDPTTMPWQKMKKSLTAADRTLTISMPLAEENRRLAKLLVVKPLFDGVGASCPVSVTANGVNVGTFDMMDEPERTILLRGGAASCDGDGRLVISIKRPEGCGGALSFDAVSLVGSWQIAKKNGSKAEMKEEGKGVPQVAVMGDPIYKHVQRSLTKLCPSLSLLFDVPEDVGERCTWLYSTRFLDPQAGFEQPIHIEVNGSMIWTNGNVAAGAEVELPVDPALLVPGLNELKLCYDSPVGNWISIDWHQLKLVPPPTGSVISIR